MSILKEHLCFKLLRITTSDIISAKEESIRKYRVASINLRCKRVNKHNEGDSKVHSLICLLFV